MADKKTKSQALELRGPQELSLQAITAGATPEHLQTLLDVQLRWEANEARKLYTAAMARFKTNCPPVLAKGKRVEFGQTKYSHTTLAAATIAVTPYLSEQGLSVTWETAQKGDKTVTVTCVVSHESGHSERTPLTAPLDTSGSKNVIQALGSTVSYLERYTLLAALGISTADMDDDALSAIPPAAERMPQARREPQQQPAGPPVDYSELDAPRQQAKPKPAEPKPERQTVTELPGSEPQPSSEPQNALDQAVMNEDWDRAYELCETAAEVRGVGRALHSLVAQGPERDRLIKVHGQALHRCSQ
jgi:hypothetical protein